MHHHVLDVDVEDRRTDSADTGRDVHPLPHEMAGVEVGPDRVADGLAHRQQRWHVVDEVDRVQLETDPGHAVGLAVLGQIAPESDALLPLPADGVAHVLRPGIGDPVRHRRLRRVSRRPRLGDDAIDPELAGQPHRLAGQLGVRGAEPRVKGKCADIERRE